MYKLITRDLIKSYSQVTVVKHVSLDLAQGQVVGILGPNGAGKTTTFYMIAGIIAPDSGYIGINDIDITHLPIHKRAGMGLGYLPQDNSIFRQMTIYDNIMSILELNPSINRDKRMEQVEILLAKLSLNEVRGRLGVEVSGGERRRAEIARVLALNPKFILLDEPFAGIDPISIQELKQIIRTLSQSGIGILITDHNFREIFDVCDYINIIFDGKVIASGSPDDIKSDSLVQSVYLGNTDHIEV